MPQPPSLPLEAPESLSPPQPAPPAFFDLAIAALWQDRVLQVLLAFVLAANFALFAYLVLRFENLPDPLPLHFDSAGTPDRIESKNGIFALPIIGITVFFLNTGLGVLLHRNERAATILLIAGALFVQALLWIAVINIVGIV